jgi:hypothetical protein
MQKIKYSRPHWVAGYIRKEQGKENFRAVYQSNSAGELSTYARRNGSECKIIQFFDGTLGKMTPVWVGPFSEFKERFSSEISPPASRPTITSSGVSPFDPRVQTIEPYYVADPRDLSRY